MKEILVSVAAAILLGGCAGPDAVSSADPPSEREYPTGSNIPRKSKAPADANIPLGAVGARVYTRDDLERIQNSGASNNPGPDMPRSR
jgi:hypothetical protein